MYVVATAGHVDHGKSTLVKALTGMEPDRWEEERRRALTIDLGYVWTQLPTGETVSFVDVPGHRRFIGNMLAGLGPVPAVLLVVAADEGWRAQTEEHLQAIEALGLTRGLLVVTRSDLADPQPALAQARERLAGSGLADAPAVAVSARTGAGLDDLRRALSHLLRTLPEPRTDDRVRLWVDRAFTIAGAGTVVTGTLGAGTLRTGDTLSLATAGDPAGREVKVRGLQALETSYDEVPAVARVAVNLRGVPADAVARGDALLTPHAWHATSTLDVLLGAVGAELPGTVSVHVGTAAVTAHVRRLGGEAVRLVLDRALPLVAGDRLILREPGGRGVVTGAQVVDADPPQLRRRGPARARAEALLDAPDLPDLAREVLTRGVTTVAELRRLGFAIDDAAPEGVVRHGDHLIAEPTWVGWRERLLTVVDEYAAAHPLSPWAPAEVARHKIGVPSVDVVVALAAQAGLETGGGTVHRPGVRADLGAAEAGMRRLEESLRTAPFAAPEKPDLDTWRLGPKELAAAVKAGRIVRIADDIFLLPSAPALAMRELAALPQPFTTSQARQAWGTTRRVAVPLLEHLDARGWTRRIDAGHRVVVR